VEALSFLPHSAVVLQVRHDPVEVVLLRDAQLVAELGHGDPGVLADDGESLLTTCTAGTAAAAATVPTGPAAARGAAGGAARAAAARLLHPGERFLRLFELQIFIVERSKLLKSIIYLLALLREEVSHSTLRGKVCI
jgi:hypothetical protein